MLRLANALEDLKKEYSVKREIMPLGSAFDRLAARAGPQRRPRRRHPAHLQGLRAPAGAHPVSRARTRPPHLLSLYDLKKPIEIGYTPLDEINKTPRTTRSARKRSRKGKFVQMLTNQPRTVFYVASVRDVPAPNQADFVQALLQAFGHDQLADRAQVEAAKQLRSSLCASSRELHKVEPPSDEVRKSFDSDAS